jgi:hypothetical protein
VRCLRDLDLGAIPRQHPDRNLQSLSGWVTDTDRSISPLRSAKDPQGSAIERVKGVEDLKILIIRARGIVGVGAIIRTSTASSPPAARLPTISTGFTRRALPSSCR